MIDQMAFHSLPNRGFMEKAKSAIDKSQHVKPAAPLLATEAKDWKNYPFIAALLETEKFDDLGRKCEGSCREIDKVIKSGDKVMALQAQKALTAYGRALDLIQELLRIKKTLAQERKS